MADPQENTTPPHIQAILAEAEKLVHFPALYSVSYPQPNDETQLGIIDAGGWCFYTTVPNRVIEQQSNTLATELASDWDISYRLQYGLPVKP